MTAARVRRMAEEIAIARCKSLPEADAASVARRALEEAQAIAAILSAAPEEQIATPPDIVTMDEARAERLARARLAKKGLRL